MCLVGDHHRTHDCKTPMHIAKIVRRWTVRVENERRWLQGLVCTIKTIAFPKCKIWTSGSELQHPSTLGRIYNNFHLVSSSNHSTPASQPIPWIQTGQVRAMAHVFSTSFIRFYNYSSPWCPLQVQVCPAFFKDSLKWITTPDCNWTNCNHRVDGVVGYRICLTFIFPEM